MKHEIAIQIKDFIKKLNMSEDHAEELADLCESAYDDGFDKGHSEGDDEGYSRGSDEGYDDGYKRGENDAIKNGSFESEHLLRHGIEDRNWKLIEEFAEKVGVQFFIPKPAKAG